MAKLDLTELRDFIREPVAVQLASCGAGLAPESVRGYGVRIDDQGALCLGLIDAQAPKLLQAMLASRRVAVNLTHPLTFHGRQVKGPLLEIEEPSSDAADAARQYFARFVTLLAKIGLSAEQCRGMFFSGPTRWIRMQPAELFDQTPGPGAGAALAR